MSGLDYGARAYRDGKPRPDRRFDSVKFTYSELTQARVIPDERVIERTGLAISGHGMLGDGLVRVTFVKLMIDISFASAVLVRTTVSGTHVLKGHVVDVLAGVDDAGGPTYVRLSQPDGPDWYGFGGYGLGHDASAELIKRCETRMQQHWPSVNWRFNQ